MICKEEKSEDVMQRQENHDIPRQEMNEANEGNKKKKERNASRNTKTEYDEKEEEVLKGTSEHMFTPTRQRSQQLAEAITMKNNRDTKVADYEELNTSPIKYLGNNW